MAILRIARMGHPVLRQVAEPVPPERIEDPEIQGLVHDMLETLRDYEGAGLAAPQVHVPLRVVVFLPEPDAEPVVLFNPELTFLTDAMLRSYEGCLSVPDMRAAVNRVGKLRVDAVDRKAQRCSMELEGFPAIALQHECDHLDGTLFIDRCDLRTLTFLDELRRFGPLDPSFRRSDPEQGGGDDEPPPGGDEEPATEPPREPKASGPSLSRAVSHSPLGGSFMMGRGPRAEG
jgi:peptide deformylase